MTYLGFSFAALDSLVPYAAVLRVARQRFVETLRHVKKLGRLLSSLHSLFPSRPLSFIIINL